MKIDNIIQPALGINRYKNLVSNPINSVQSNQQNNSDLELFSYPQIYFTGKINPLKIDITSSKKNLIKILDEILQENLPDVRLSEEEINLKMLRRITTIKKRMENYVLYSQIIKEGGLSGKFNRQQAIERINNIRKEVKRLTKTDNIFIEIGTFHQKDEKTDYDLIQKFKDSVLQDKYNFSDVFIAHYERLKDIKSLDELKEMFPHIQLPQRPENVIADKLESTLTRDFYEDLYHLVQEGDMEAFSESISKKIVELLDNNIKVKNKEEAQTYFDKLSRPIVEKISLRLKRLVIDRNFSSLPEFRKVKKGLITNDDMRLLNIDYDDFVLSVIREQYLNLKNPNEIVYTAGDTKIKISSVNDLPYKFDKIPNRIKGIIKTGEDIKAGQRNYDRYTTELFQQRLEFYGDRLENEEILKYIVDFSSCKFEHDDINMLKRFLNGADSVWDGKMTQAEFLDYIFMNSISPVGTERINSLEQKAAIIKLKQEQKKVAALYNKQTTFDTYINTLYKNGMSYIAELCSAYKPETLEETGLNKAKIIIDTIKRHLKSDSIIANPEKLGKILFRKLTYFEEFQNPNADKNLLNVAKKYATLSDGSIDIEKAGKYIINSNIVNQYPESIQYVNNRDIVESIIKYFGSDKEKAVEYLCKYDEYLDLPTKQKSKISNITNLFNIKNTLDKNILKSIIENDYLLSETSSIAILTDAGNKRITATIMPKAKQEIYDYYKFPKCLEFFSAFEDALSQFATNKNSSGIKRLGRNNDLMKNVIELKIKGYPDRLVDYSGLYKFDSFLNTGFH